MPIFRTISTVSRTAAGWGVRLGAIGYGDGSFDRISVFRGDDIGQLSLAFAQKHGLEEAGKAKLELLLRRKVADNALQ